MPKKGGKKAKVVESPEEKALREETERMKAEEDRRRKEETMRKKLSDDMQEEARFAKLNLAKIQNQWRKLMRLAKVESLRKDLEIMSQNHEREVDMKDAIIQMLDRDCERALPTHPTTPFPLSSPWTSSETAIFSAQSPFRRWHCAFTAHAPSFGPINPSIISNGRACSVSHVK